MTTFTLPTTPAMTWTPSAVELGPYVIASTAESFLTGNIQSTARPNTRWALKLEWPEQRYAERAQIEGFLNRLQGQMHRAAIGNPARPTPSGTISTTGVTVASAAPQFATLIPMTGMGATKTLLAGDLFSVPTSAGTQLCMCAVDVTSAAGGTATVEITQPLRGSITSGAAVTLSGPTALFVLKDPNALRVNYGGNLRSGPLTVEFVEVFA